MFKIINYRLSVPHSALSAPLKIALVADLHNNPADNLLRTLETQPPQLITVVGDLLSGFHPVGKMLPVEQNANGFSFLRQAAQIAPTFYSLGNHERYLPDEYILPIAQTGAILLDNAAINLDMPCGMINVGGLSSRCDLAWLKVFSAVKGFKLLLCHHPEYYPRYVKDTPIDVMLSGHTHGGQWRIGKQGFYSPGQGIFPRYTGGVYDNRLIVSRGLANTAPIPRLGNAKELVYIDIS